MDELLALLGRLFCKVANRQVFLAAGLLGPSSSADRSAAFRSPYPCTGGGGPILGRPAVLCTLWLTLLHPFTHVSSLQFRQEATAHVLSPPGSGTPLH